MIGSDVLTLPAQSQTLLGESVSNMIGTDVQVYADGSVTGTLKYIASFPGFSSKTSEQSGHYFPFVLGMTGTTMTFKKNGTTVTGKSNMPFDPEIIFRVDSANTTFTVEVDGVSVVTLNFKNATLA